METLIVVDQHTNQYYGKNRDHGSSSPRVFREINCRTFNSGTGLLPTPIRACTTPATKRGFGLSPNSAFAKTPLPAPVNTPFEENKKKKTTLKKSSSVPIPVKNKKVDPFSSKLDFDKKLFSDEFSYSELWAGPAYSNSPPPSSLPMPKFFVPPKRTVSLDLPASSASEINLHPIARSAPPSPKREHNSSARSVFHSADSTTATRDLRRILNLDVE